MDPKKNLIAKIRATVIIYGSKNGLLRKRMGKKSMG